MATYYVHRSQRTPWERAKARANRREPRDFTRDHSVIRQTHGDAAPTAADIANAVQWQRGVETSGHQTHTFGPRFDQLLPDVPASAESAGPSPLHIKVTRRG